MRDYLNSTTYNISWFKKAFDAEELEMHPPFQRNPVWTVKQKSYLIDSVLRGYPIPEIYLQEKISSDGKTIYSIVDGQQRIRAVLDFMAGNFVIEESESDKWANMEFDDLSEADKISFYSYKFVIRVLPDIGDAEIRSIFQRINKNNIALNAQELRQSTYSGDFIQSMKYIADKEYWKELGVFSPARVRRMLDVEFISELTIAYLNGHQNKKKKLDYYYELYEEEYEDISEVESVFDTVILEILQTIPEIKKTRWSNMVDFYTLFLVLADNNEKLPLPSEKREQLAEKLVLFSTEVSNLQRAKNKDTEYDISNSNISDYASGIRNSSDLGSRKIRYDSLLNEISEIIS